MVLMLSVDSSGLALFFECYRFRVPVPVLGDLVFELLRTPVLHAVTEESCCAPSYVSGS